MNGVHINKDVLKIPPNKYFDTEKTIIMLNAKIFLNCELKILWTMYTRFFRSEFEFVYK